MPADSRTKKEAMLKPTTCLALGLTLILSSVARAEHIVAAHIEAIGGADAIAKIKTIRRTGKTEMKGLLAQGTIEQACVVGKKALQVLELRYFPRAETC